MFRIILFILASSFIAPSLLAMDDFPLPTTGSSNIRSPRHEMRMIENWLSEHGFQQGIQDRKQWSSPHWDLIISFRNWIRNEGMENVMKREDAPQISFWGIYFDGINPLLWCEKYDLKLV